MSLNALDLRLVQDLPPELSSYILETAARLDRNTARNLVLVSKTMQSSISPILYHTVSLPHSISQSLFAQSIRCKNSPAFFTAHVKILCLRVAASDMSTSILEREKVQLVLSTCTGVVSLAFWMADPKSFSIHVPSSPKYISFLHLPSNDITSVLTSSITVLDFLCKEGDGEFSSSTWNDLFSLCPNLTTLILEDPEEMWLFMLLYETVSCVLESPRPSLESIILRPNHLRCHRPLLRLDDPRIVIVPISWVPGIVIAEMDWDPNMVFLLPEAREEGHWDDHQVSDWTCPAPAPHSEPLWERVERWKKEGRRSCAIHL